MDMVMARVVASTLNTQLRQIRNVLSLGINIKLLSRSDKVKMVIISVRDEE
jgi:hypothetical protein